jgi:hypothetical protein
MEGVALLKWWQLYLVVPMAALLMIVGLDDLRKNGVRINPGAHWLGMPIIATVICGYSVTASPVPMHVLIAHLSLAFSYAMTSMVALYGRDATAKVAKRMYGYVATRPRVIRYVLERRFARLQEVMQPRDEWEIERLRLVDLHDAILHTMRHQLIQDIHAEDMAVALKLAERGSELPEAVERMRAVFLALRDRQRASSEWVQEALRFLGRLEADVRLTRLDREARPKLRELINERLLDVPIAPDDEEGRALAEVEKELADLQRRAARRAERTRY